MSSARDKKHISVIKVPSVTMNNTNESQQNRPEELTMCSPVNSTIGLKEQTTPVELEILQQSPVNEKAYNNRADQIKPESPIPEIKINNNQSIQRNRVKGDTSMARLPAILRSKSSKVLSNSEVTVDVRGGRKQKHLLAPKNIRKQDLKSLNALNRKSLQSNHRKQRGIMGMRFLTSMSVFPAFTSKNQDLSESDLSCTGETNQTFNIWQAVRDRRLQSLQTLLKNVPGCVNDLDNRGMSALHLASKLNYVPVMEVLIQNNADVNIKSTSDLCPLHVAARHNSREAVRLLIDNKASVICRNAKQKTPLHIAIKQGHKEIAAMLLEAGGWILVDLEDEDALTPLHEAVLRKQTKMVSFLLDHGANIFAEDINDVTPFQAAACEGMVDVMEILLNSAMECSEDESVRAQMVSHTDNEGNTSLHMAVLNNKIDAVEYLIKAGSPVNQRNNGSNSCSTPLHMAAVNGSIPICCLLLNNGASLEKRDKEQMTAIHRAALYNRWQIIELLMNKGGDINAKSDSQMTPLMMAVWKGHLETTNFLLTHGGQISETDDRNRTVLHWAIESGNLNITEQLLQHGCSSLLDLQDNLEQTPLHYAAMQEDTTIMYKLLKHGCRLDIRDQDGKVPLHVAAERGNSDTVDALVSHAEINDGDADGKSPLIVACEAGNYQTARALIKQGADLAIRDEEYRSALMVAASEGHSKLIELLIENFAEVDQADKIKNTALHMAAYNGHTDCVKLLLLRKATVTLRNSYSKTALDVAIEHNHSDAVTAILQHKNWKDVMEVKDAGGYTPMRQLIEKVPDAAMVVLDNCVEYSNHKKDDLLYTTKFDYKYIDPGPDDECCKKKRFYALRTMVQYKREDLLGHQLTQSLLLMKWQRFGRPLFYVNLISYFTYLCLLLLYTTLMPKITTSVLDDVRSCPVTLNSTSASDSAIINQLKAEGAYSYKVVDSELVYALIIVLNIIVFIYMIKELIRLMTTGWRYFLDIYVYMTWAMLVSTIFMLLPAQHYPCENEWRAGWISALLAWTLFMLYLRGVDVIGMYFVMFTEVLISLLKVAFVLVLFLMAFSTALGITAAQTDGMEPDDFYSLTVMAMTLGEMNFVENFMGSTNTPFKVDNLIIMCLFMVVMPIALMNLLIGVAVGDIDKIQKQAYLTRLNLQIELICQAEESFPRFVQRKLYQRKFEMQPNLNKISCWSRFKRKVFGVKDAVTFISEDKEDVVSETLRQIKKDLKKQKLMMIQMQILQKQQQEMMKQLCQQLDVNVRLSAVSPVDTIHSDMISRMDFHH